MPEFPWFPFYPGDWFSSGRVKMLTLKEKGAYIDLLGYAWESQDCMLSNDEGILKRLVSWDEAGLGADEEAHDHNNFQRVLNCFKPHKKHPNKLYNPRLSKEWKLAHQRHDNFSQRGRQGAVKRWAKESQEVSPPPQPVHPSGPTKQLRDREGKGFTKVGSEIQTITDKHFPPV